MRETNGKARRRAPPVPAARIDGRQDGFLWGCPRTACDYCSRKACVPGSPETFIGTLSVCHSDAAHSRDDHRRLRDPVSEQLAALSNNPTFFAQTLEGSLSGQR